VQTENRRPYRDFFNQLQTIPETLLEEGEKKREKLIQKNHRREEEHNSKGQEEKMSQPNQK